MLNCTTVHVSSINVFSTLVSCYSSIVSVVILKLFPIPYLNGLLDHPVTTYLLPEPVFGIFSYVDEGLNQALIFILQVLDVINIESFNLRSIVFQAPTGGCDRNHSTV